MDDIEIVKLAVEHVAAATSLVCDAARRQQADVPALPGTCADGTFVAGCLRGMAQAGMALAALLDGRVAACLGWYVIPRFRGTAQTAAYCPEFAHAAEDDALRLYEALYVQAATRWTDAGCGTHALTLYARDRALEQWLYSRGFGLAVVDAIAGIEPLRAAARRPADGLCCRRATLDDVPAILDLDRALCAHLHQPHIGMPLHTPRDAAEQAAFLGRGQNSVWLACDADPPTAPSGLLRFEVPCTGAVTCVRSADTVAISGAFVRGARRARGVARTLLDAGLAHYQERSFARCSVDWESFNPEAHHFWPRHFTPVCHSLIRHVEDGLA